MQQHSTKNFNVIQHLNKLMAQKTHLLCTRCCENMAEPTVLIDDSPGQKVGTFKPMGFTQCIELENISH